MRTGLRFPMMLAVALLAARILLLPSLYAAMGGQAAAGGQHPPDEAQLGRDTFGRIFRLPPFAPPSPEMTTALLELGKRGGLMDARDDISAGPIALIVDPALSRTNKDNEGHTAGITFLGQFLDHDMTFDTTSRLGQPTNPRTTPNARHPYFDLDSVYGDGPTGSPLLYDPADRTKFRLESAGRFDDLPRDGSGAAIIADPRNDENVIVAGLHIAFLRFHNHVVDIVRSDHANWPHDEVFREARRLTTWHYQWMILHDVLPLFVGPSMMASVMAQGTQFFTPASGQALIPVDFQIVYRFGHSMVRPSYRANFTGDDGAPFFAMLFEPATGSGEPNDLRGGLRSPRRFVGWQTFFRFPGFEGDVRPNKRIDTKLSTPLFDLPLGAIPAGAPPTSLAQRNLLRHLTWRIPSGQSIALAMGVPPLNAGHLAELWPIHPHFVRSTPLWYYVLKEAEVLEDGLHLGPVGGRIVAEVFIGLLRTDPEGFLTRQPEFTPSLGSSPGEFHMTDLLAFAGVADKR
jgi:Animal haem peroxidase